MSFIASSQLWGEENVARLCQIIMDANDGMAQQVMENRTDLLDLRSKEELEEIDDIGLSLLFLSVYYDRPDIIRYLHKRGLDFSKPCDPMSFGTPMFYAVNLGKSEVVETLNSLGYSVNAPCETLMELKPSYYASRTGDLITQKKISLLQDREEAAMELLRLYIRRRRARKTFLRARLSAIRLQKVARGRQARELVRMIRSGEIVLGHSSVEETEDSSEVEETEEDSYDGTGTHSGTPMGSGTANSSAVFPPQQE